MNNIKREVKTRINLFKIIIKNNTHLEFAYVFNNYASIFSAVGWGVSIAIYAKFIFSKTQVFAGLNIDQMLLFLLIGHIMFFINNTFISIFSMIDDVRFGNFDFTLIRPIPKLFYTSLKDTHFDKILLVGTFQFLPYLFFINWNNLNINISLTIPAIVVMIFGLLAIHCFQFILGCAVFWLGHAWAIVDASWIFEYNIGRAIPIDGMNNTIKTIFLSIIPVSISTGLSTSVLIGKTDPFIAIIISATVAIIGINLKSFVWNRALKIYTSESS